MTSRLGAGPVMSLLSEANMRSMLSNLEAISRRLLTISSVASKFRWTTDTWNYSDELGMGCEDAVDTDPANLVECWNTDVGVVAGLFDGKHFVFDDLDIVTSA